jgi:putative ABC transport system permease protein
VASAIIFNTNHLPYVADYLSESPIVGTVDSVDATLAQYVEMMEPYTAMYSVMFVMGIAIAFAIIYNTATISLSERQREFATLRVLGMTVDEVCEIMRFEYWVLAVVGIVIGIPSASLMLVGINSILDTSMMSMPTNIATAAYIMAVLGCIAAIVLSNISTKRKVRKFDMIEVLKERE